MPMPMLLWANAAGASAKPAIASKPSTMARKPRLRNFMGTPRMLVSRPDRRKRHIAIESLNHH
jgi:hypothetical protein